MPEWDPVIVVDDLADDASLYPPNAAELQEPGAGERKMLTNPETPDELLDLAVIIAEKWPMPYAALSAALGNAANHWRTSLTRRV